MTKLLKVNIIFVMSVRLFVRNNSPPTERIFMKSDIWEFLEKTVQKIRV
jgi:hypothetical protein